MKMFLKLILIYHDKCPFGCYFEIHKTELKKLFLELLLRSNLFDALPRDGILQRYQSNQAHFQYYLGVFVDLKVKIGTLQLFS